MHREEGMTLIEILIVLTIIGITAVFCVSNFTAPNQQAVAANVQNNLLAIYSAEQNYSNNNGGVYCTATTPAINCGDSLADLNTSLSLNIQDDGSYNYSCSSLGPPPLSCTATSVSGGPNFTLTLNQPVALHGGNPTCSIANLCP